MKPEPQCRTGPAHNPGSAHPGYRHVQGVLSPRAGGLSLRLNLNPDGACNFDCVYCDVDRGPLAGGPAVPDVTRMMEELADALGRIAGGCGDTLPGLKEVPAEFLRVGQVALSGAGEPTLCPVFSEVVDRLLHLRSLGDHGFFKIALITNASGFHLPGVLEGVGRLHPLDEVWAKLDAGSPAWFHEINRPMIPHEAVIEGLQRVGTRRGVVLQTMLPRWRGRFLPLSEQEAYTRCVQGLVACGVRVERIQLYSVLRPAVCREAAHATLSEMSGFARAVRGAVPVPVQVY